MSCRLFSVSIPAKEKKKSLLIKQFDLHSSLGTTFSFQGIMRSKWLEPMPLHTQCLTDIRATGQNGMQWAEDDGVIWDDITTYLLNEKVIKAWYKHSWHTYYFLKFYQTLNPILEICIIVSSTFIKISYRKCMYTENILYVCFLYVCRKYIETCYNFYKKMSWKCWSEWESCSTLLGRIFALQKHTWADFGQEQRSASNTHSLESHVREKTIHLQCFVWMSHCRFFILFFLW